MAPDMSIRLQNRCAMNKFSNALILTKSGEHSNKMPYPILKAVCAEANLVTKYFGSVVGFFQICKSALTISGSGGGSRIDLSIPKPMHYSHTIHRHIFRSQAAVKQVICANC